MNFYDQVLSSLDNHPLLEVRVGLHWTAVVADKGGQQQCGLATTLRESRGHSGEPLVPGAGRLETESALDLAGWITSEVPLRRSIGCAAVNALLDLTPGRWVNDNAVNAIRRRGAGKKVVLVGDFPFKSQLQQELEDFTVLDQQPEGDVLPAAAAPEVLPEADVVAITGMTFINRTLGHLLGLCSRTAYVIVLGPTTPLSPVLHDHGVDLLAGSVVQEIPAVLNALMQGGNFRQLHRAGVQLVLQTRGA
jgi:uncharacterized protein (DUF4213/DUF364 family)